MGIKQDLTERLQKRLLGYCIDHLISYDDYVCSLESIEKATIEQLWTLYDRYADAPSFILYAYNPQKDTDYLAMEYCGMYVGIEQDGYAHS